MLITGMPRRLRIQYPGAIYHVMARGNGRQDIVRDDADRDRLQQELGRAVGRCGWRVYAFVILSNHLHVVLKTPQPNLARGMQAFLSAYANASARRHRFCGHVFQGRYRAELVEDETYLWTVTRYVHLNPVRPAWWSIPRPGGGRVIPAMPIAAAGLSGSRMTNCWRPGVASSVVRIRPGRTDGM